MPTLTVRSARVMLPGGVRPATIAIRDGRIASIGPYDDWPTGVPRLDAAELTVLPGLVDTHVHINEPGRTEWEGFAHATRAAAAGGITTLIDMPLNSIPPTTSVEGLRAKRQAAEGKCHVDVGFWGGVVPGNAGDIDSLARAGVFGFKCFLAPSGVAEFEHVTEADLRLAMPRVAASGLPLLVHAELPSRLREPVGEARRYDTWLASRPAEAEHAAIELVTRLARESGARVHIVHVSSALALDAVVAARTAGVATTAETCPHYLTFAADEIADAATAFKCAPPIRGAGDRERLWQALIAGDIDLIATDHSPAPASLKLLDSGDFVRAWGGIASLQVALAAVWTGARARGMTIERAPLADWMAAAPAGLAGLDDKGAIAPGRDADLVIWDPDATTRVDAAALYSRHAISPYSGRVLEGRVKNTLLRGEVVFDDREGPTATPRGTILSKVE
jgi:allantoinase